MSLKQILSAGFAVCMLASPAWAVPTITVTPSNGVNAQGNRVWTVQVVPDGGGALPSSLAVELPFTIAAGSATQPMAIINTGASNTNTGNASPGNDTWYYNETSAGSTIPLWNITDAPVAINNFEQNVGDNPFMGGDETEGLFTSGANLFAALGSTIINSAGAINTIQIVTDGGGGILQMGAAKVGQNGQQHSIAAKNFYVPADWDGNGTVGGTDFDLLLQFFGQPAGPAWDGFRPVNPLVSGADFDFLLQNFGAGTAFGSGSGAELGNNVPEPSTIALFGLSGLLASMIRRRRR